MRSMHPDVARKMKMIAVPLTAIAAAGFAVLLHGLLCKGWWTYLGLIFFLVPLPFLLALGRIWLYSKRLE
jgi:hypothetical protein